MHANVRFLRDRHVASGMHGWAEYTADRQRQAAAVALGRATNACTQAEANAVAAEWPVAHRGASNGALPFRAGPVRMGDSGISRDTIPGRAGAGGGPGGGAWQAIRAAVQGDCSGA